MAKWDWYVHGLWIVGTLFVFFGALLAGNLAWIEGTNELSFTLSVVIAFLLLLVGGLMWISAGANAVQHELDPPADGAQRKQHVNPRPISMVKRTQEEVSSRRNSKGLFMDRRHLKF